MRASRFYPLGLMAGAAAGMGYAVRGRSSSVFGPSVYHGPRWRRSIALTFDDGPSESTAALLGILHEHRVPATFFQCGANIRRLPEVARAVFAAGHEIGNHSDTHAPFYFKAPETIAEDFAIAQNTICDVLNVIPRLMRAPYGVRWFGFREAQRRLHLLGVMWTVLGRDWKLPAASIARRVIRAAANGAIICLHDGRQLQTKPDIRETVEAVRRIVPVLQSQGYHFETVSQLLCPTT
jgi:peptidoglycan/xylan/chitin deacetylase (PgdA/CDA1 family)